MSPQAVKDKDKTQDADLEADAPPLAEQENPTVFDGDIEKLNADAPPLGEQKGAKTDLNALGTEGLHKTSHTFGTVYSDYETDGAGHGPKDFATDEEVERADQDAKDAQDAIDDIADDADEDDTSSSRPSRPNRPGKPSRSRK